MFFNYNQIMINQREKEELQTFSKEECRNMVQSFLQKIKLTTVGKPYPQKLDEVVRRRKVKTDRKGDGVGKWTLTEQKIYISFLEAHSDDMQEKLARKSKKVFIKMSNLISTRSANQCRSHHQKLLQYHHSLHNIIHYYRQQVFPTLERHTRIQKEKMATKTSIGKIMTHKQYKSFKMVQVNENLIEIQIGEQDVHKY